MTEFLLFSLPLEIFFPPATASTALNALGGEWSITVGLLCFVLGFQHQTVSQGSPLCCRLGVPAKRCDAAVAHPAGTGQPGRPRAASSRQRQPNPRRVDPENVAKVELHLGSALGRTRAPSLASPGSPGCRHRLLPVAAQALAWHSRFRGAQAGGTAGQVHSRRGKVPQAERAEDQPCWQRVAGGVSNGETLPGKMPGTGILDSVFLASPLHRIW